jgi:hypothetical protein
MKLFAVFMTILMILTGFDPCKDKDIINSYTKIEVSKAGKENADKSVCNPFCNCTRCPFSIVLPQQAPILLTHHPVRGIFIITIDSGTPTRISASVWQPPQFTHTPQTV